LEQAVRLLLTDNPTDDIAAIGSASNAGLSVLQPDEDNLLALDLNRVPDVRESCFDENVHVIP
jgi:hypothetical protein